MLIMSNQHARIATLEQVIMTSLVEVLMSTFPMHVIVHFFFRFIFALPSFLAVQVWVCSSVVAIFVYFRKCK